MDAFISVPANGLIIHAKRYENAIFCMKWVVKIKEIQKFCYNHQLPIRLVVGKVNDREKVMKMLKFFKENTGYFIQPFWIQRCIFCISFKRPR